MENTELNAMIHKSAEKTQANASWKQPEVFDYNSTQDQVRMQELFESGQIQNTFDPIKQIAESEFELAHPELKYNEKARQEFVNDILSQGNSHGEWVYMQGDLIRYPQRDVYRELRTYRYRNLVTKEEQAKLNEARPSVFGLSVGGNIAVAIARNGIGKAIAIGDPDTLDVTGIGRNVTTMRNLTESKLDAVAKQISQIDPFIEQKHFKQGFSKEIQTELAEFKPDALFDEVDHMPSSATMREFCKTVRLPYFNVSDVGERAILEVIRHDLRNAKLYAGHGLSDKVAKRVARGEMSGEDESMVFTKTVGMRNVLATPRLIESSLEVGKKLAGIPQLGSTALMAAGYAVAAYRNVLLGRANIDGMSTIKIDNMLNKQLSFLDYQNALYVFLRAKKS